MKHLHWSLLLAATLLFVVCTSVHSHGGGQTAKAHSQWSGRIVGQLTCRGEPAAGVLLFAR